MPTDEEIVKAMALAISQIRWPGADCIRSSLDLAKAALAVAKPMIREQCAEIAHQAWLDGVPVAEISAAIRQSKEPT